MFYNLGTILILYIYFFTLSKRFFSGLIFDIFRKIIYFKQNFKQIEISKQYFL